MSLFGIYFCKTVFIFVKQNLRAPPKKVLFGTPVSVLFLKTNFFFFFFFVDPMPYFKRVIRCFHYLFFLSHFTLYT
jgi:hypothetical protein